MKIFHLSYKLQEFLSKKIKQTLMSQRPDKIWIFDGLYLFLSGLKIYKLKEKMSCD